MFWCYTYLYLPLLPAPKQTEHGFSIYLKYWICKCWWVPHLEWCLPTDKTVHITCCWANNSSDHLTEVKLWWSSGASGSLQVSKKRGVGYLSSAYILGDPALEYEWLELCSSGRGKQPGGGTLYKPASPMLCSQHGSHFKSSYMIRQRCLLTAIVMLQLPLLYDGEQES